MSHDYFALQYSRFSQSTVWIQYWMYTIPSCGCCKQYQSSSNIIIVLKYTQLFMTESQSDCAFFSLRKTHQNLAESNAHCHRSTWMYNATILSSSIPNLSEVLRLAGPWIPHGASDPCWSQPTLLGTTSSRKNRATSTSTGSTSGSTGWDHFLVRCWPAQSHDFSLHVRDHRGCTWE